MLAAASGGCELFSVFMLCLDNKLTINALLAILIVVSRILGIVNYEVGIGFPLPRLMDAKQKH